MNTPAKRPQDDKDDFVVEEPDTPDEEPCPDPVDPPNNAPGEDEYVELGGDDDTSNW